MDIKINLTECFSKLAHRLHPKLGEWYDKDVKFWNDGFVGFVIGVPLTWMLYTFLILPNITDSTIQFGFYILCALISFCVQHYLRREWVFRSEQAPSDRDDQQ